MTVSARAFFRRSPFSIPTNHWGGPEDDRLAAAPAMGVGVGKGPAFQEGAGFLQLGRHLGVGVQDRFPHQVAGFLGEAALVVNGGKSFPPELQAHLVVLLPVPGGGVDATGPGQNNIELIPGRL